MNLPPVGILQIIHLATANRTLFLPVRDLWACFLCVVQVLLFLEMFGLWFLVFTFHPYSEEKKADLCVVSDNGVNRRNQARNL